MRRREFVGWAGGVLGFAQTRRATRPNVLLVVIDDLGWSDLGCQGSSFHETPHIDRLADEGARFTNAYANCPACSASRAALPTGRFPARVGFTGHITATGRHRHPAAGRILPPDDYLFLRAEEVTLAEALRPGGYVSPSVGKWRLGPRGFCPDAQGFDMNVAGDEHGARPSYFYPDTNARQDWNTAIPTPKGGRPGEYLTDRFTREVLACLEHNHPQPFFLYLPHDAVHTPLPAPPPLGMFEHTLIVVTSDNGGELRATSNASLREGKGCLYELGIRVPLLVSWRVRVRVGARRSVRGPGLTRRFAGAGIYDSPSARGNSTRNAAPRPGSLSHQTRPCICSTSRFTMARPSPVECSPAVGFALSRAKVVKRRW